MNAEQRMSLSQCRLAASSLLTEECVKSAARILESLDKDSDPCEDFYQFACGGWISQHPVPESQTSWDQFRVLREQLLEQMRGLLEEDGSENEVKPVQQARMLYRVCLDTGVYCALCTETDQGCKASLLDKLEVLGLKPILTVLRKLGLSSNSVPPSGQPFDWLMTVGQARRMLGLNIMVGFSVNVDFRDSSRNIMMVDQISPGISERYLLDPLRFQTELNEYHNYIRDMVQVFQRHVHNSKVHNATLFADDILHFSTQLASIMTPAEARRGSNNMVYEMSVFNLQTLTNFKEKYGSVNSKLNWFTYLRYTLQNTNITLDYDSDHIIVMDIDYLQKLAALVSVTDQETVERFVWWRIFSTLAPLTLQEFRDLDFRFSQKVFGLQQKTSRWKQCTRDVNSNFGMAVSYLYVQKHFNNRSMEKALEMVNDIQTAFTEIVMELDWMDSETKERILEKAHAMRPFIGFPGWLLTPGGLEKYYEGAEVVDGWLFKTYLRLKERSVRIELQALRKAPDHNSWVLPATTVSAYYMPVLNSVTFPAGILQPPFYGLGLQSLNYGVFGTIMGHELTHGFDDAGRQYDKEGNVKQWWTEATLREYEIRKQCIVEQYSQYRVSELGNNFTVNGIITQGENIADNGGLREAFRAYLKNRDRIPDEQLLPGLAQYSPEQLFFLGFAHMWCGNSTQGALKSHVVDGVHSPRRFRVIGTLSNSKEFADAWGCPAGSPMNPHKKCVLW